MKSLNLFKLSSKCKHLYIHIPFCQSICTYCDFVRKVANQNTIKTYLKLISKDIKKIKNQCDTIYLGGGTPNFLSDTNLIFLLKSLQKNCQKNTEFTIECNPEFVTSSQVAILKKYHINRISLGAQCFDDKILNFFNRRHNVKNIIKAISIFKKFHINNISCDLIYGYNELTTTTLKKNLAMIKKIKIPHISFYSLELKKNSLLNKKNYLLNHDLCEEQLSMIISWMKKNNYHRYEVSNWATKQKYFCRHNLCYWNTLDWIAIGDGAYGLIDKNYYYWKNFHNCLRFVNKKLSKNDYFFQIISMGLRQINGISLKNERNFLAYQYFKDKLKYTHIKNNYLIANNINLLNETLINLL